MIKSFELEKKVISGILQHQEAWGQVSNILTDEDFYFEDSKVNVTIFRMLKSALDNAESIDETILIYRVKQLGMTFPDSIDITDYIQNLTFMKVTADNFLSSVRELKKVSIRREGFNISEKLQRYVKKADPSMPYNQLVDGMDKIYNDGVSAFEMGDEKLVNLADIAEQIVEDRGDNPPEEVGLMGPYQTLNKIYGSLVRAGNITCVAARAKVGKTSLLIDMLLKISYEHGVPILHFDNGEMSEEELVFRMVSGASGIPVHLLESGKWRHTAYKDWTAQEVVERVRNVWDKMKKIKILYHNVAGMSSDEMCSLLKRYYYSDVGRGNPLIFSFDYLKTDFGNLDKGAGWAFVGKTLHDFKQLISRELKFDGNPCVAMVTSVQTNRLGITNNRDSDSIVEDESVIGLSDNIIQFVSHLFLLRKKTIDERVTEGDHFGTHKLICLAARHLGEDAFGHLEPVEDVEGNNRNNFVNLHFSNFNVEDRGDLRDIVRNSRGEDIFVNDEAQDSGLPAGFN
jgi:replicative DNA helicase|tara:strand:+ start:115 stop:1653 length:1539 start_codon:yes stop_codon:yes gene_type:complete